MGINQPTLIAPRQEQREPKEKKKDWVERVIEGLQIAKGITGVTTDYQTIKKYQAERAALQDARDGIITKKMDLDYTQEGMQRVDPSTPGATRAKVRTGDDTVEDVAYIMPKKKDDVALKAPTSRTRPDGVMEEWDATTGTWKVVARKPAEPKDGPGNGGGKNVSGEVAQNIGKFDAAMDHIGRLENEWLEKTGVFSGAMQYVAGTDAAQYRDAAKVAGQDIGQILEGGKLTDSDRDFYIDMMPTAGDSEERAAEKFRRLKEYVASRKASSVEGARQAGFNTAGFTPLEPTAPKLGQGTDGKAFAGTKSPPKPLSKGAVEDGYEFLGGNPADKNNWKKVAK